MALDLQGGFSPVLDAKRQRKGVGERRKGTGRNMGGRGGSSGMTGNGSPENVARQAFNNNNGVNLQAMKSELKSWREAEKRGYELDEDQHYWVIDKDGTEHFYQPGVDAYAESGINLGRIAYISNSNGDGRYDSNGVSTVDNAIQKLFQDPDTSNKYDDEINRLYKTAWGRSH